MYQPKTGQKCGCRRGIERDNCPTCEGTGWVIDFAKIRKAVAKSRLEYLRGCLRAESISWDELHELQSLGERGMIDPSDTELLEAAGVPEFPERS